MNSTGKTLAVLCLTAAVLCGCGPPREVAEEPEPWVEVIPPWLIKKRNLGDLIKQAKIAIITEQPDWTIRADALLDTVGMEYGPISEALYWRFVVQMGRMIEEANVARWTEQYTELTLRLESLRSCCDDEKIKRKYRRHCSHYLHVADSIAASLRHFPGDTVKTEL